MPATTFAALLAEQLRNNPGRPLVTFYDDATGERVELSVTTYANWVAKTAGLLTDELDVERGSVLCLDLPTHWLGAVWVGAAWSVGAALTLEGEANLVVTGPDHVGDHAASGTPVVALSLLPMAGRFRDPLPEGVVDYSAVVWGQPDAFLALDPPSEADLSWLPELTQGGALEAARGSELAAPGTRLLTDLNPATPQGASALLAPLAAGGGTVWVRHVDESTWDHHAETERATARLRA